MSPELILFLKENKNLINQNTKESWEKIYDKLEKASILKEEFTNTLLSAGIDPAEILGYIPREYLYKSNIANYKIPDSVAEIGYKAFFSCNNLTSITIPNSVTWIGSHAFDGCSSLTSVVIGNSVTEISIEAFYNCDSLTSIEIPDSVTAIEDFAFALCDSLMSVTINSVTSIGQGAFCGCNSLKEINFKGTKKQAIINLKVKNKKWRQDSSIEKIICIDGVIEL